MSASRFAQLILLFLLAVPSGFAQLRSLDVSQYLHTSWTVEGGFLPDGINALTQTSDGYLWLVSSSGLLRFDGVRFVEWQPPNNESLPKPLGPLLTSTNGSLWIGGKGLAELKVDGEFHRYHELDGLTTLALVEDKDGAIWDGGIPKPGGFPLCRIYRGQSECYGGTIFPNNGVTAMYEDREGRLWASSSSDIWTLRPGPFQKVAHFESMPRVFCEDAEGRLLFSNASVTKVLTSNGRIEDYPIRIEGKPIKARSMLKDREGSLWIGTAGQGIVHIHEGRVDRYTTFDGLSRDTIPGLLKDREGNVWAASSGGLDKFTKPPIARLTRKQGLSNDAVISTLTDRDGTSWVGTMGGLDKLNDGRLIRNTAKLPNETVLSLFETSNGRMIVATDRQSGMVWLDGDKTTPLRGPSGENIFQIVEDRRGELWAASRESGLVHMRANGDVFETFSHLGLFIDALAFDPKRDGLWLASGSGQLWFFKEGKVLERYGPADGLGDSVLHDPQVDSEGGLWIGTHVGLAHLSNGKLSVLGRKNGLPCETVHWMRRDEDHNVWLYAECGLVSFSEKDLLDWVAQSSHQVTITHHIDSTEGVDALAYGGWYTPQTAFTKDGRILFVTGTALGVLDPRSLNKNSLPPPVHIEEIAADGRPTDKKGQVLLPPRVHAIHLAYTALSFSAPRRVRFRYKLEGYDPDWSPPVSLRDVSYTNLPPGNYRFHVIASNNDGVWNNEGATLDFRIPPAWFQTIWFRAFCVAVATLMAWSIYRLRVRQIATAMSARFDERLAERTRLARELHDTLLQTIQGSKLVAANAMKHADDPHRTRRALEQLSEWLVRATDEGRAALHSLRMSTTETNDLAAGLRRALEDCRRGPSMDAALEVTGEAREMHPIVRDEIYLIGYEAIRNAHMHSEGTRLDVGLTYGEDLSLIVKDNGNGVDPSVVREGKDGHFGLPTMRERAARVGGRLTIASSVNSGTEVKLVVPGNLAFRKPRPSPFDRVKTLFDPVSKN